MAQPLDKSFQVVMIDFVLGALFADGAVGVGMARGDLLFIPGGKSAVALFLGVALIGGSLAALFRNYFWSEFFDSTAISPGEETVSKGFTAILWTVLGLGCALLVLSAFVGR